MYPKGYNGDRVTFAHGTGEVTVDAGGVEVADMTVSGGEYTFKGGSISSSGSAKLTVSTVAYSGTADLSAITAEFKGGIDVISGDLKLGNLGTATGGVTVGSAGSLQFTQAAAVSSLAADGQIILDQILTVTGDTTLNNTVLLVDASNDARIESSTLSLSGDLVVDLHSAGDLPINDYLLMLSESDIAGFDHDLFTTYLDGRALNARQSALYSLSDDNKQVLLDIDTQNLVLTWNAAGGSIWDVNNTASWQSDSANPIEFLNGDSVIFDATADNRDITLAQNVTVADMTVAAGNYSFTGYGITGDHLDLSGGSVVFDDTVLDFANGIALADGAAAILRNGSIVTNSDIENNGSLTFDITDGASYKNDSVIAGAGNNYLTGTGSVELAGDSSAFAGTTTTTADFFILSGNLGGDLIARAGSVSLFGALSGDAYINSGASLTGWGGSAHSATIAAGGTLNPWDMTSGDSGIAGGTLTFDNLIMEAGSILAVSALDGLIYVTGTAELSSDIDFLVDSAFANGTKTILNAEVLDWADVREATSVFYDYSVTKQAAANDRWDLVMALEQTRTPSDVAKSHNQRAVAGVLGDWTGYYDYLLQSETVNEARQRMDMATGEALADLTSGIMNYARDFWKFRRGGIQQACSTREAVAAQAFTSLDCRTGYDAARPLLWFEGGYNHSRSAADSETARSILRGPEFSVGGEMGLGSKWLAGAAFRYGDHNFKVNERASKFNVDNYELGLYAVRRISSGPLAPRVSFGVRGGYHDIDSRRNVFGQSLRSEYNAWSLSGYGELALEVAASECFAIESYANVEWTSIWNGSFRERGGDLALEGASGHQDNRSAQAGVRLQGKIGKKLSAELDLGWRLTHGDLRPSSRMNFQADPLRNSFTVFGAKLARDEAVVAAGVSYAATDRVSVRIGYDGTFGNNSQSHTFSATAGVGF